MKFELSVARSYLIPRKGRLSQSITALFGTVVISTIVWLTLVYFSTIQSIEERWTSKIQQVLGLYEIIPNDLYFKDPSSEIATKKAKNSYSLPRLSLAAKEEVPSWDEEQDGPLEARLLPAIGKKTPLVILLASLKKAHVSYSLFDQQVAHLQCVQDQETLSQYVLLRGTDDASLLPIQGKGYPLLAPIQAQKQGIKLSDSIQLEQAQNGVSKPLSSIKAFIAGFYDPGVLPLGAKLFLCSSEVVTLLSPSLSLQEPLSSSGISITNDHGLSREKLQEILPPTFSLRTYKESPMTHELFAQLQNESTLFQLLAAILLFVASSNILSMLFIIARDRKKEIALFRALGMKRWRIGLIFSLAGLLTGTLSLCIGFLLAQGTLHFLPECLSTISWLQGQSILDPAIFGTMGRESVRLSTLFFSSFFVLISSTLAGLGASLYASKISISEALKEP